MEPIQGLGADALSSYGLNGLTSLAGKSVQGALVYERPAFIFNPRRLKNCTVGAFSYINGHGSSAMYRCALGRYCSIGEDVILGPPEHPVDHLSTHPFAFSRPDHLPSFYVSAEFAALAPDDGAPKLPLPPHTEIGHDVWIGAGAFVRRGLRIGHGAVVAAHAVVTQDVPPYAVVVGMPARVLRLRFAEATVERLLQLAWWQYDLAPHKRRIDFANIDRALDTLEGLRDEGALKPLHPETWRIERKGNLFSVQRLDSGLF
ncbi:MAG: hypothetical protein NVS9B10_28610 [Nevskia sp.]